MKHFEQTLARVERWIEAIDRERDDLARSLDGTELKSEIHTAFVKTRLGVLETERSEALKLLAYLDVVKWRPELLFPVRPRMVKMPARRQNRKTA